MAKPKAHPWARFGRPETATDHQDQFRNSWVRRVLLESRPDEPPPRKPISPMKTCINNFHGSGRHRCKLCCPALSR